MYFVTYLWLEQSKLNQGQIPTLRRNPILPDPPEALASPTSKKTISQDPGYSFLKNHNSAQMYTTCTEISSNCKRERRRERGAQTLKSVTAYSGLAPPTE